MIENGVDAYGAEYKRTSNDFHIRLLKQDNGICSICHGTGAKLEVRYITRDYISEKRKWIICGTLQEHEHTVWICPTCLTNFHEKLKKMEVEHD